MRAVLVAAVGYVPAVFAEGHTSLHGIFGATVAIPEATNGSLQAYDSNRREQWQALADPGITIYTRRQDVPNAIKAFLIAVRRSDSPTAATNPRWVRFADLKSVPYVLDETAVPGDYFRVRSALGAITVKLKAQMIAGDRPVDWTEVHSWLGVADELGET